MSSWKPIVWSIILLSSSANAVSADCDQVKNAANRTDGAWLFHSSSPIAGERWRKIAELNAELNKRPRLVRFAYIVKQTDRKSPRRGVLIIKSGKSGINSPKASSNDKVRLARPSYNQVERCESFPSFRSRSVTARSYDQYHDYGYKVAPDDQDTIGSFHVSYRASGRGCKRTNDAETDQYFAGRWQSNRSQFSFDKYVVDRGQYSQFFAQFRTTSAYASSLMSERRVEIMRYVADDAGMDCVMFSATVFPGTFIRVNDLELRREGGRRAKEQSWEWPR